MMRCSKVVLILFTLHALGSTAHAQTAAAFRVLFGVNDATMTRWDGSLKVVHAGQHSLESWRFEGADDIVGDLFHFSTRPVSSVESGGVPLANGFIITVTAVEHSSEFSFSTAQGEFSFHASEVSYGKGIYKLGGESISTGYRFRSG